MDVFVSNRWRCRAPPAAAHLLLPHASSVATLNERLLLVSVAASVALCFLRHILVFCRGFAWSFDFLLFVGLCLFWSCFSLVFDCDSILSRKKFAHRSQVLHWLQLRKQLVFF